VNGVVNIGVFVLILIVLIILHELGHMVVAKWCGMRVERFSVFFGKPIASFRRGETEYGIGWLPLGGYVKITGMTREELVERVHDPATGEVVAERPLPPEVQARAYCNATTPRKVATILAGPAANVLVAIIAFAAAFWVGLPQFDGQIDRVQAVTQGTPAAAAGLLPGDRLVSVNGVAVRDTDPTAAIEELRRNVGRSVTVVYERDGTLTTVATRPLLPSPDDPQIGILGFRLEPRPVDDLRLGFVEGLREAVDFTGFVTKEQVVGLGRLFVDEETREQVSSPIGIGATYNEFAEEGLGTILRFVGLISLILAIMNLIPLLPLDGGHILFALVERIRGRPLNIAVYQRASAVGIALVAVLFIYAVQNDIGRLTGEGFRP
jgi:regulator of sigma E protease